MATAADRLEVRLDTRDKQEIERAAQLKGQKVSVFVRDATLTEARRVVAQHELLTLSTEESRAMLDALAQPFTPNDRLRRAMRRAAATDHKH